MSMVKVFQSYSTVKKYKKCFRFGDIKQNNLFELKKTGREGWWHGLSSLISIGVIFQLEGGYISFSVAFQPNPAKR